MPAKVLVVEDEAIVALDLVHRLQNLGYIVCGSTANGQQAIQLANDERPDLVLMDIRLDGDLDGIETAAYIRDKHGMNVIFITAYSDDEILKRALNVGAYRFLLKPFDDRELRDSINDALKHHS